MKPAVLIAVVFGAIIAGGAGGFLAAQFAAPTPTAPVPQLSAAPAAEHDDLKPELDTHAGKIVKLTNEVDRLVVRLNAAEEKARQADGLAAKVGDLTKQLETVRANPAATTNEGATGTIPQTEIDRIVDARLEAREKEQAAAREAERERGAEEFRANMSKRAVDTLTERLSLNSEQAPKVKAAVEAYVAKSGEIWRKGMEARRNNQEFDWNTEIDAANKAATEEVKALLSSAQLTTFNELVGDRGLRAVTDPGRGPGGGNFPGGNRRGGNRGGNND